MKIQFVGKCQVPSVKKAQSFGESSHVSLLHCIGADNILCFQALVRHQLTGLLSGEIYALAAKSGK